MVKNGRKWSKIIKKVIFGLKNLLYGSIEHDFLNGNQLIRNGTQNVSSEIFFYRTVIFLIFFGYV